MITCFLLKRKLYDFVEDSLSEKDRSRVQQHIAGCLRCQEKVSQLKHILAAVAKEPAPVGNESFWLNFQHELDEKLTARLLKQQPLPQGALFKLKPAFSFAMVSCLVLIIGAILYPRYQNHLRMVQDQALIQQVVVLEDVAEMFSFVDSENEILPNDIELLDELGSKIPAIDGQLA
ncbi:MAG: zf-HC2 domain-containing protein [Candidatus Omnitrophica bacterium]|nr:zf-HC2 domain-containing protein [Candidatus Omnitrophota bacterium]